MIKLVKFEYARIKVANQLIELLTNTHQEPFSLILHYTIIIAANLVSISW